MFSKALFKQSCKANGTMWAIITFAVCFMLACVMLISGSGSLGEVKNAIQDTIIVKEVDSAMEKRAVGYFINRGGSGYRKGGRDRIGNYFEPSLFPSRRGFFRAGRNRHDGLVYSGSRLYIL